MGTKRESIFDCGITLALLMVTLLVAVRRYGLWAMATGVMMKHAAIGRANRSSIWGYCPSHRLGGCTVTDVMPAARLIERLQFENQFALVA